MSLPCTAALILQEKYIHFFPTQPRKPKRWETSYLVSCQGKFLKRKMVVYRQWYRQCWWEKFYIWLDYLKKCNANGNHMYVTGAKYKRVRGLPYGENPADIDKILGFSWWLKGFSPAKRCVLTPSLQILQGKVHVLHEKNLNHAEAEAEGPMPHRFYSPGNIVQLFSKLPFCRSQSCSHKRNIQPSETIQFLKVNHMIIELPLCWLMFFKALSTV